MIKTLVNLSGLCLVALFSLNAPAAPPWANDENTETEMSEQPAEHTPFGQSPAEGENQATQQAGQEAEPPRQRQVQVQQGDVLAVPPKVQAVGVRLLDFPRRGMTTDKVQNELGRPNEVIPAVGEPPISRWIYDDRIVYFERSSVIHVVAK